MSTAALREIDPLRVGPYLIIGRLGSGGMGVVYHGRTEDGVEAAVKVLRSNIADSPEFLARFRREIDTLRRIGEICRVPVLDAAPDGTPPYLATAFVPGPTLADRIQAGLLPEPGELRTLGRSLAVTLAAIHDMDIVHRDLTPNNIILAPDGPRIIDFGIARLAEDTTLTRTGASLGTPGYLAPEQITGSGRKESDVFAWAATLAHAASGRSPFGSGHPNAVIYRLLHAEPDLSGVPGWLAPLLAAALHKDPQRRPAAAELADRLRTAVFDSSYRSRPAPGERSGEPDSWDPPTGPTLAADYFADHPADLSSDRGAHPNRLRPRRHRRSLLGTLLLAVTMLAAGGVLQANSLLDQPGTGADDRADTGPQAPGPPSASGPGAAAPDPPGNSGDSASPSPTGPTDTAPPSGAGGGDGARGRTDPTDRAEDGARQVTLEVTAVDEDSRVSVRDDRGETVYDRILQVGQSQTFLSRSRFTVTIGNAGAVRLRVNGTDTGPAGGVGQVARFSLSPENSSAIGL